MAGSKTRSVGLLASHPRLPEIWSRMAVPRRRAPTPVKTLRRFPWLALWSVLRDNNIHTKLISRVHLFCVRGALCAWSAALRGGRRSCYGGRRQGSLSGWGKICAPTELQPDLLSCFPSVFCRLSLSRWAVNMIGVESVGKYVRFLWRMLATIANWLPSFSCCCCSCDHHGRVPCGGTVPQNPRRHHCPGMLATTGEPIEGFLPRWDAMGLGDPVFSVGLLTPTACFS